MPDAIVRTLDVLQGGRLLLIRGVGPGSFTLRETFRPERLVERDLPQDATIAEPSAAFDGVFLFGLLPRFVDPEGKLFGESLRVLRTGGMLLASTPDSSKPGPIAPWARQMIGQGLDMAFVLTRGQFELVDASAGAPGLGRFSMVARKLPAVHGL